jgi:glycosyltransferase involved in cell wall biosynthesis
VRILFVTQVPLDRPHGGARHVAAVARELARLGHEVALVAPGEEPEEPRVRRVRSPKGLGPGLRLEGALAFLAMRETRRRRFDVAYVRMSASSSLVPLALFERGLPIVLELNGRILDELKELGRGELAIKIAKTSLTTAVGVARAVVAVEAKIGRHAESALGAKRVVVIENGADLDKATPGDRSEARRVLGLDPSARYLAFTGTLVPELRLDLLLEAQAQLDGVAILVAGDGPQAPLLEAARAKNGARIVALGVVPHERAILAIRAADVCVNVRDGDLGMKCLEYAAVGRRLVTFDVEGADRLAALYPELEAVHLVDERSARALAASLARALDAEARLGPLPPAAIEEARKQLGWDRTARRIAEVLERCASFS